jgi:type IV secretory pathway TrbL component
MIHSRLPSVATMTLLIVIMAVFHCLSVQADTIPTLPHYNSQPANSNSNNNSNNGAGGHATPALGTVPQGSRRDNGRRVSSSSSSRRATSSASSSDASMSASSSSSSYFDDIYKSTREEVLATREARKVRLVQMIGAMEQQLKDHAQGHRHLNEYEKNSIERRRLVYNRKLDTMLGELDIRVSSRCGTRTTSPRPFMKNGRPK